MRPQSITAPSLSLERLLTADPALHVLAHFEPAAFEAPLRDAQVFAAARPLRRLMLVSQTFERVVRERFGDLQKRLCWAHRFNRFATVAAAEARNCHPDTSALSSFGADMRLHQAMRPLLDPQLLTPSRADAERAAQWHLHLLVRDLVAIRHEFILNSVVCALMADACSAPTGPVDLRELAPALVAAAGQHHGLHVTLDLIRVVKVLQPHLASLSAEAQAAYFVDTGVLLRTAPAALQKVLAQLAHCRDSHPPGSASFGVLDRAWDTLQALLACLQAPDHIPVADLARQLDRLPVEGAPWGAAAVSMLRVLNHRVASATDPDHPLPPALVQGIGQATTRWLTYLCDLNRDRPGVPTQHLLAALPPEPLWAALQCLSPTQRCALLERGPSAHRIEGLVAQVCRLAHDTSVPLDMRIDLLERWLPRQSPGELMALGAPDRALLQAELERLLKSRYG